MLVLSPRNTKKCELLHISHTLPLPQSGLLVIVSFIWEHQIVTYLFIANKAMYFLEVQKESTAAFQSPKVPAVVKVPQGT